ncbi:MAG: DNA replication and repair protein RecF, partial [Simkaniaceae bacterium]|nr:DNA replication and repair protein RecF [Simkaniaceae bacterium]
MIRIKTLFLQNFRNYARTLVEFGPHVNYLQGKNGQGKTNLLEAIYFISTGRSFRTDKLCELIRDGSRFFHIEVIFEKQGIDHHLKLHFDGQKKSVEINETKSSNFSVLLGLIPSVIASPSDIDLIMGCPQNRRRYLNLHIAQSDPVYVYHLSRYNKALKQRNALLKIKQLKTMDIWEEQMAQSAAYLVDRRIRSLKKL